MRLAYDRHQHYGIPGLSAWDWTRLLGSRCLRHRGIDQGRLLVPCMSLLVLTSSYSSFTQASRFTLLWCLARRSAWSYCICGSGPKTLETSTWLAGSSLACSSRSSCLSSLPPSSSACRSAITGDQLLIARLVDRVPIEKLRCTQLPPSTSSLISSSCSYQCLAYSSST